MGFGTGEGVIMDVLIDTFLVGLGAIGAHIISLFLKKKLPTPEPGVYSFQKHTDVRCHKCDMLWEFANGFTYCECEEYHKGHFHVSCNGKGNSGCKFKWIMRTK